MKAIIFVDDEVEVLQGIKRMLRSRRKEWKMEFARSGEQALKLLQQERFNVVVTDMRMPLMDGAKLLEKVRKISPHSVRIVLSGHSEESGIMRAVRPAHQYLAKPVEKEELERVLQDALNLQEMLADPDLIQLVSQVDSLPALPSHFKQLLAEMDSENCSLKKVGETIAGDMGMTATILKVVNSAFFTLSNRVNDPVRAVTLLGTDTIKALVLSHHLFSVQQSKVKDFSLQQLWTHSLTTAGFARVCAQFENWDRDMVDQAYLAGMLHDVGKLILMTVAEKGYAEVVARVRRGQGYIHELERKILGTTHGEAGAYLLGLWGFNVDVLRATGLHHRPFASTDLKIDLLTVVHVANTFDHELVVLHPEYSKPGLDMEYLDKTGAFGHVDLWRKTCRELFEHGGTDGEKNPA
jgi:HD-like signal output (HDOD) protein